MNFNDNDLFVMMGEANKSAAPGRIKGYYICSVMQRDCKTGRFGCGIDFIKSTATSKTICPFCGNTAVRTAYLDTVGQELQHMIWKECGTYSDRRAGLEEKKIRKGA